MQIILIGYGKMGKTIEEIAHSRGHQISQIIDIDNHSDLEKLENISDTVAIEFTQPHSAVDNLKICISKNIPVVCGTTGWLADRKMVEDFCLAHNSAFFYASNYSIGVNLFFNLNHTLAKLMQPHLDSYQVQLTETHHTEKKDAPSGTAITLAEGIINEVYVFDQWINEESGDSNQLPILSYRVDDVPGTHAVAYHSEYDTIEIKHTAHSRQGFALGAVIAAEWLLNKKGVFSMEDLLKTT
jgi:4-hydroxy-tetrahydrodipicolinate reductase